MYISILRKIPVAVIFILFAISLIVIYFRSKKITHSEFVNKFKTAKYIQAWVLIAVIVLTGVFGVFNHFYLRTNARAVISLNYSEASLALNSNGTRYNMAEITCDDVIKKAIKMGALENVTVKQLKNCLSVYPYVQGDAQAEDKYHISTEFVVEYYASKDTQHLDAVNVIQLISSAYKEYYIEKYTDNFKLDTTEEKPDFSKMEYLDIVAYLDKEATSVLNYLYGMANKSPSFVTSNKSTFNSIAGKVFQFRKTQIEQNLKSLILQQGLVKDKAEYIDRLYYHNTNADFDRAKNQISFDLCNQAIAMYSEEMTRIVLVPTWDEVGKYYMGRTKVGIDELSVMATNFSNDVATKEKEIDDNKLVLGKIQQASGNTPSNQSVDQLIVTIDKGIENYGTEAIIASREFFNHRMNQCVALSIYGVSLFSELKDVVIFAVLAYMALMLYSISRKFRKEA